MQTSDLFHIGRNWSKQTKGRPDFLLMISWLLHDDIWLFGSHYWMSDAYIQQWTRNVPKFELDFVDCQDIPSPSLRIKETCMSKMGLDSNWRVQNMKIS